MKRGAGGRTLLGIGGACAAVAAALALVLPGAGSASRLYVAVGDSVGAGSGSTSGHSYFDLYCAYLKSAAGGSLVDRCINESVGGLTTATALAQGVIQRVVNDIDSSGETPLVTVILGGNDLLHSTACQPVTAPGCMFMENMRTILSRLEGALASRPGSHAIQWLEYYNPSHDNPHSNPANDHAAAQLLLGSDLSYSSCTSAENSQIGLDDAINCVGREMGASPVDAYAPFQSACVQTDCFFDAVHPDDAGYRLIFGAFRDGPRAALPVRDPLPPGAIDRVAVTRRVFAARRHHHGGAMFVLNLSRAANVTMAIERRRNRRRVATRIVRGHAGGNRIWFSGRVRGHALTAGRYRAVFALTGGTVRQQKSVAFKIIER
jgi:lysophospholipase L1-like esterase